MSCLIAHADATFDELLFRPARGSESRRSFPARSLFDLSVKPIRAARFEPRIRREEDAERWDGLS
ncbi:MAG: hypothetical protein ABSB74_11755 [Tepidisphaeraceae bacterium]